MAEPPKVVERVVEIVNQAGLHARPVMRFVDLANTFASSIQVNNGRESVDGKSPMDMMLLEASKGKKLQLTATGSDAEAMMEALVELVAGGFGEA